MQYISVIFFFDFRNVKKASHVIYLQEGQKYLLQASFEKTLKSSEPPVIGALYPDDTKHEKIVNFFEEKEKKTKEDDQNKKKAINGTCQVFSIIMLINWLKSNQSPKLVLRHAWSRQSQVEVEKGCFF